MYLKFSQIGNSEKIQRLDLIVNHFYYFTVIIFNFRIRILVFISSQNFNSLFIRQIFTFPTTSSNILFWNVNAMVECYPSTFTWQQVCVKFKSKFVCRREVNIEGKQYYVYAWFDKKYFSNITILMYFLQLI